MFEQGKIWTKEAQRRPEEGGNYVSAESSLIFYKINASSLDTIIKQDPVEN